MLSGVAPVGESLQLVLTTRSAPQSHQIWSARMTTPQQYDAIVIGSGQGATPLSRALLR
jgi:hypothetical protein